LANLREGKKPQKLRSEEPTIFWSRLNVIFQGEKNRITVFPQANWIAISLEQEIFGVFSTRKSKAFCYKKILWKKFCYLFFCRFSSLFDSSGQDQREQNLDFNSSKHRKGFFLGFKRMQEISFFKMEDFSSQNSLEEKSKSNIFKINLIEQILHDKIFYTKAFTVKRHKLLFWTIFSDFNMKIPFFIILIIIFRMIIYRSINIITLKTTKHTQL